MVDHLAERIHFPTHTALDQPAGEFRRPLKNTMRPSKGRGQQSYNISQTTLAHCRLVTKSRAPQSYKCRRSSMDILTSVSHLPIFHPLAGFPCMGIGQPLRTRGLRHTLAVSTRSLIRYTPIPYDEFQRGAMRAISAHISGLESVAIQQNSPSLH